MSVGIAAFLLVLVALAVASFFRHTLAALMVLVVGLEESEIIRVIRQVQCKPLSKTALARAHPSNQKKRARH